MDAIVYFAKGFMYLFEVGGNTFVSWVTGIIPKVLLLLVFYEFNNCFYWTR